MPAKIPGERNIIVSSMPIPACPPSTPSGDSRCISTIPAIRGDGLPETYQGLRCSVQSMSVVSSELWVGTLERWISRGLWLLDAIMCAERQRRS
jgi:hypothetical protein